MICFRKFVTLTTNLSRPYYFNLESCVTYSSPNMELAKHGVFPGIDITTDTPRATLKNRFYLFAPLSLFFFAFLFNTFYFPSIAFFSFLPSPSITFHHLPRAAIAFLVPPPPSSRHHHLPRATTTFSAQLEESLNPCQVTSAPSNRVMCDVMWRSATRKIIYPIKNQQLPFLAWIGLNQAHMFNRIIKV